MCVCLTAWASGHGSAGAAEFGRLCTDSGCTLARSAGHAAILIAAATVLRDRVSEHLNLYTVENESEPMDGLILILFYVSRSSEASAGNSGGEYVFNYTSARRIDRPQTQDIIQQVRADLPSRD